MKVEFGNLISLSFERTKDILIKPFNFRKWIILGFVAWLSGQLSVGGGGGSFPTGNLGDLSQPPAQQQSLRQSNNHVVHFVSTFGQSSHDFQTVSSRIDNFFQRENIPKSTIAIIVVIGLGFVSLFLLFGWIGSVFYFVFLDDLIENKAELKIPFRTHMPLGNSYFIFNFIFSLIILATLTLIGIGGYRVLKAKDVIGNTPNFPNAFPEILIYVAALIGLMIVAGLINWSVRDFALPIMMKQRISIIPACKRAISCIGQNLQEVVVYLLLLMGLGIALGIAAGIITLIIWLTVGLIGLILMVMFTLIAQALPGGIQTVFAVSMGAIGIIAFMILGFFIQMMFVPLPVFFRVLNLRFLGEIEPDYKLLSDVVNNTA